MALQRDFCNDLKNVSIYIKCVVSVSGFRQCGQECEIEKGWTLVTEIVGRG
jgi:hypothetical protein